MFACFRAKNSDFDIESGHLMGEPVVLLTPPGNRTKMNIWRGRTNSFKGIAPLPLVKIAVLFLLQGDKRPSGGGKWLSHV
jgi:hypothetical protein